MKHRSRKNSRPAENLQLRREYASSHPVCEIGHWLYPHFKRGPATETHHNFSRGGRHDLVSNLIRLSADAHRWCHQFPTDGRVACIWIKTETDELDIDEFRKASGFHLDGWLCRAKPRHAWCGVLLQDLMEAYCK